MELEKTVKETGADAVFDYKTSTAEQVTEALKVLDETKGNLHYVLDAAAAGVEFARMLFKELPEVPKYFATTNDWYVRFTLPLSDSVLIHLTGVASRTLKVESRIVFNLELSDGITQTRRTMR
jgi:hypothetical protein